MPFIEVSSPHTLQYLKDLGFKTFHHFWDESYDEIENHTDRFIKICELITYLDELPDNELRAIAKWSHTITQWNREKVENFRKDRTILK
jgi:DNA-binding ferritin-like protein